YVLGVYTPISKLPTDLDDDKSHEGDKEGSFVDLESGFPEDKEVKDDLGYGIESISNACFHKEDNEDVDYDLEVEVVSLDVLTIDICYEETKEYYEAKMDSHEVQPSMIKIWKDDRSKSDDTVIERLIADLGKICYQQQ
ncbi:hypothetical protein KI387_022859, partial [Taxus chinensis]